MTLEKNQDLSKELVSIVVPVYNVQAYLDKAVASIINQTYKNLEIILVDDGSPDNSGRMCDEWAAKDDRIRVVHKQNCGLSSARNAGISIANGKYIGFVDSDDYISPDAIEQLLCGFSRYKNVGIVSGMIKRFYDGDEKNCFDFRKEWIAHKDRIIPSECYLEAMLMETASHSVWNKLFLAEIVKATMFKEGRNNEDTLFDYYLSKQIESRKLLLLEIPSYVYFYRCTPGSICNNPSKPLDIDVVANYHEMLEDLDKSKCKIRDLVLYLYTNKLTWIVDKIYVNSELKNKYYSYHKNLLNDVSNVYIIRKWPIKNAVLFFIIKYFPKLRFFQKKYL